MPFSWNNLISTARAVVDSTTTPGNEDLSSFVGLIDKVCSNTVLRVHLMEYRGNEAQLLLDTLHRVVTLLSSPQRKSCHGALLDLSQATKLRPTVLTVAGAQKDGLVFCNQSMDIHKGTFEGRVVAFRRRRDTEHISVMEEVLNSEAVLLSTLNHPGVISCNGVFNEEDGLGCYLVCRYCEEGTVVRYLRSHPEADRFLLVKDVVGALSYLHTEGVVHGDLRGANILVDATGRACVANLGFSRLLSATSQTRTRLEAVISSETVPWKAPEILEAAITNTSAGPTMAGDIYSLGCLKYEIFIGQAPFWDVAKRSNSAFRAGKIMIAVLENGLHPSKPRAHEDAFHVNGMTEEVWTAMENCWAREAGARPTASDLAANRFLVDVSDNRPTSDL